MYESDEVLPLGTEVDLVNIYSSLMSECYLSIAEKYPELLSEATVEDVIGDGEESQLFENQILAYAVYIVSDGQKMQYLKSYYGQV